MSEAQPRVVMYTTAWCPYCVRAKLLLGQKGVAFEELRLEERMELRAEMQARSGRTSVPQIFIGDRHIGGFDDMAALDRSGELDLLLGAEQA